MTDDLIINMLISASKKVSTNLIEEAKELELDVPDALKVMLLANVVHGKFILSLTKDPSTAIYGVLFKELLEQLLFEKEVLLESVKNIQQKNRS
jgi:hypothetical protein